jgi:hypothetical protein
MVAYLSDDYVINGCSLLKPKKLPTFLSLNSRRSFRSFIKSCEPSGNIPSENIDQFHELWKRLLSDAIIYLKWKDKREFSGNNKSEYEQDKVAFGVEELFTYFEKFREFEALLYGADQFYRDHIMHVFRVWLIGMWLMEKFRYRVHWDFKEINAGKSELTVTKDEVFAMWCIIALTHDLGYPLHKIEKLRRKIEDMMIYFGGASYAEADFQIPTHHHFINDFILQFISSKLDYGEGGVNNSKTSFRTSRQSKYYLKFSKSFEKFEHGIISCILLMKNLVYFLESDLDLSKPFTDPEDARQFYIRREILRAIASHTCTDIYHLYPNSLAFMLILADELQSWGRPTFSEMKAGRQVSELKIRVPETSESKIEIEFELAVPTKLNRKTTDEEEIIFKFRQWYKWLRSALGAGERNFVFSLKIRLGSRKEYHFVSKPGNMVRIYINNKEQDLAAILYS